MLDNEAVIASGNLATSRRTIMGVLGQLALFDVREPDILGVFTGAGLPARALQEPDFPISLEQELTVCVALLQTLPPGLSPTTLLFQAMNDIGIENLGVLGMAMRHAATATEAFKVCMTYPQLTWGHTRMTVRRSPEGSRFSFAMERPRLRDVPDEDIDGLVDYCLALDLVSSLRNIQDVVGSEQAPLSVSFPFPQPADWQETGEHLGYAVHFAQKEACFVHPADVDNRILPAANPLLYRSYVSIAENLSQMLAEEFSLRERVIRWLWAYTPPPRRAEIARLLSMSERNLTRQLGREGTSYSGLLAQVQEERAKNFLRNPSLPVSEIGYRLGYSEPAAFTRAFTSWTGVPPKQWRKSAGAN